MSQHILPGETNKFEYHWYGSRDRSLGCLFSCRSLFDDVTTKASWRKIKWEQEAVEGREVKYW